MQGLMTMMTAAGNRRRREGEAARHGNEASTQATCALPTAAAPLCVCVCVWSGRERGWSCAWMSQSKTRGQRIQTVDNSDGERRSFFPFYLPIPFFYFPSNDTFFYKTYLGLTAFAFNLSPMPRNDTQATFCRFHTGFSSPSLTTARGHTSSFTSTKKRRTGCCCCHAAHPRAWPA